MQNIIIFRELDNIILTILTCYAGIVAISFLNCVKRTRNTNIKEKLLRDSINTIRDASSINRVKKTLVTEVGKVFGADRCFIVEVSPEGSVINFDEHSEYRSSPEIKSFVGEDFTKEKYTYWIQLALKEKIFIPDLQKYAIKHNIEETPAIILLQKYAVKTALALPISYKEYVFGFFALHYTHKAFSFKDEDLKFLETIANQAGTAFNKIKLYEKEKERAEREKLLRKITETIRNSLDIEQVKNNIVTEVGRTFNADRCYIRLYGYGNLFFPVDCEYTSSPELKSIKNLTHPDELHIYIKNRLIEDKIIVIQDGQNFIDDHRSFKPFKDFLTYFDIKSYCAVPIYRETELMGMFVVHYSRQKVQFDEEFIETLKIISDQASMALHQAKLFNTVTKMVEQERLLKEVIAVSKSNLEIKECLDIIFQKMSAFFGAQRVVLIDVKGLSREEEIFFEYKTENIVSLRGISRTNYDELCAYWKTKLLAGDQSAIVNNISDYEDFSDEIKSIYESVNIKSLIGFLIKTGNQTWGVLFLYVYNTPKSWTEGEISTIQTIKEYISISMWEKNLYNKEMFLANISHELKTPIAIINSYTEALIGRDKNKSEMGEKFLRVIKNNVDRITNIIDDLLCLSSFEQAPKQETNGVLTEELGDIIVSTIELAKEQAISKHIEIHFNPENPVYGQVNSLLFQQALINLINNAVKYNNENAWVKISLSEENGEAIIKVQDNGIGIPEKEFKNIFQRFYCIDRSRSREKGGSGLGLSIVEKIVEFHSGRIELNSTVGEGSTFTIYLPAVHPELAETFLPQGDGLGLSTS